MAMIKRPSTLRSQCIVDVVMSLGLFGQADPMQAETACAAEASLHDADAVVCATETETEVILGQRRTTNPNDDPNAPYRIVTSNSGLLTEPVHDTPRAITILSDDRLNDMGVTRLRDLFRSQPGNTLGTGEGGNAFGDRIFVRGFDARKDVFIDGVRDPGVGSREVFGVQQIEIMRGPSSTFGGRGTTGCDHVFSTRWGAALG